VQIADRDDPVHAFPLMLAYLPGGRPRGWDGQHKQAQCDREGGRDPP